MEVPHRSGPTFCLTFESVLHPTSSGLSVSIRAYGTSVYSVYVSSARWLRHNFAPPDSPTPSPVVTQRPVFPTYTSPDLQTSTLSSFEVPALFSVPPTSSFRCSFAHLSPPAVPGFPAPKLPVSLLPLKWGFHYLSDTSQN